MHVALTSFTCLVAQSSSAVLIAAEGLNLRLVFESTIVNNDKDDSLVGCGGGGSTLLRDRVP